MIRKEDETEQVNRDLLALFPIRYCCAWAQGILILTFLRSEITTWASSPLSFLFTQVTNPCSDIEVICFSVNSTTVTVVHKNCVVAIFLFVHGAAPQQPCEAPEASLLV